MLHVMAGDKLDMSTQSYWVTDGSPVVYTPPSTLLGDLISTLAGGVPGDAYSEGAALTQVSNMNSSLSAALDPLQELMDNVTSPDAPRAYLNYLVFDESMNFLPAQSGAVQVSATQGSWQDIEAQTINFHQNGYVMAYLSNAQHMPVYFDNFSLYLYKGVLQQSQHYYPFGLVVDESQATGNLPSKYLYEGKELQDDLGYNLYDFTARQYDPQLGRFWGIDPASQFPSGYTGMGNDPANMVDPTGMVANATAQGVGGGQHAGSGDMWLESERKAVYDNFDLESMAQATGLIDGFSAWVNDKEEKQAIDDFIKSLVNQLNENQIIAQNAAALEQAQNNDKKQTQSTADATANSVKMIACADCDPTMGDPGDGDGDGDGNAKSAKKRDPNKTWDPVTNKRIDQLDSRVKGPATAFINAVEDETGIQLRVIQGYRSKEEQDELYAQGRTEPGQIVTNAPGGQSYHNFGLAIDVAIMQNGQVIWQTIPKNIAAIGQRYGFEWGGTWQSIKDYPHFQMTFGLKLK